MNRLFLCRQVQSSKHKQLKVILLYWFQMKTMMLLADCQPVHLNSLIQTLFQMHLKTVSPITEVNLKSRTPGMLLILQLSRIFRYITFGKKIVTD